MLQKMFAHAQYCSSGDQTLNACTAAIEEVGAAAADEHLTVVVSDANLQRYGITAEDLSSTLLGDHTRSACAAIQTNHTGPCVWL